MAETTRVHQKDYRRYLPKGWAGVKARANEPCVFRGSVLHVPAGVTRKPRPGDALYYNSTEGAFAVPTSDAQLREAVGIAITDSARLQSGVLSAVPTGSNSETYIEYDDGAVIKVGVMGTFYAIAGTSIKFGQRVKWDMTTGFWVASAAPSVAAVTNASSNTTVKLNELKDAIIASMNDALDQFDRYPFTNVSMEDIASGGLFELNVGYGRVL